MRHIHGFTQLSSVPKILTKGATPKGAMLPKLPPVPDTFLIGEITSDDNLMLLMASSLSSGCKTAITCASPTSVWSTPSEDLRAIECMENIYKSLNQ